MRKVGGQHLYGDVSLQTSVASAVHLTHAARANGRDDFVRTEAGSGR